MDPFLLSETPVFQVTGDHDQTLQLVLLQNQSIITNRQFIMYSSTKLSLSDPGNSFMRRLLYRPALTCTITNKRGGAEYIGISSPLSGRILAVNLEFFEEILIVRHVSILAHTPSVVIKNENNVIPYLKKHRWSAISGAGLIFLQQPSLII